ncbi:hypothetical protein ACSW9O_15395 (plasmid) [Clostridium perfringens]|nr:hypothetical protein [Clostridium perfringens]
MKQYNILEVIAELIIEPKAKFKRVNDEDFEIFRGDRGALMYRIKDSKFASQLQLFNYIQDLFTKIE